jgi:ATP-dependent DNA helicase 2 subunit 2
MFVQADPNDTAGIIKFSALCEALVDEDRALLARLVTADGRAPKLGVLIGAGDMEDRKQRMYFVRLPFAQDMRSYTFVDIMKAIEDPAKRATRKKHKWDTRQQDPKTVEDAMDEWIEKMDLTKTGPDRDKEAYKSSETYSLSYHRTWQCIAHRALHPDDELPDIDPAMKRQLERLPEVVGESEDALDEWKNMFMAPVKAIRTKRQKTGSDMYLSKEKPQRWFDGREANPAERAHRADADDAEMYYDGRGIRGPRLDYSQGTPASQAMPMELQDDTSIRAILGAEFTNTIMPNSAVADFWNMIRRREVDQVAEAVQGMADVIDGLVVYGTAKAHETAIDCLENLRRAVVEEDEVKPYNGFVKAIKEKVLLNTELSKKARSFWGKWKEVNETTPLGPITVSEHRDGMSPDEAEAFFDAEPVEPGIALVGGARTQRSAETSPNKPAAAPSKPALPKRDDRSPSPSVLGGKSNRHIVLDKSGSDSDVTGDESFTLKKNAAKPTAKRARAEDDDDSHSVSATGKTAASAKGKGKASPSPKKVSKSPAPKAKSQGSQKSAKKSVFEQVSDEDDED